jgi:predicted ArsR family transcriptional regulator
MAVIALAGRRTDAPDATNVRFPQANVDIVKERIRRHLERLTARTLVCSAACGADLVALDAAGELGLRRRVVLPFSQARFRQTSVIDRGAEWGSLFDRILAELRVQNDVVTLESVADDVAAYVAANTRILDEAQSAAATAEDIVAVLVWEGESRGEDDLTEAFGREARLRGLPVVHVLTS